MDNSEMATEIGTIEEIGAKKTVPGNTNRVKTPKPAKRYNFRWLLVAIFLALASFGGYRFFDLQRQADDLQKTTMNLRVEMMTKDKTITSLTSDVKKKEEGLQQSKEEIERLKGETEIARLALTRKESEIKEMSKVTSARSSLPKKVRDLQTRLLQKDIENIKLQKALSDQTEWAHLLSSPTVQVFRLHGSEKIGSAGGMILFEPNKPGAFFYGYNFQGLPAGKTYQLWSTQNSHGDAPGVPVSIGTFRPTEDRSVLMKAPKKARLDNVKQFSVTIEPTGGKRRPTGASYLVGEVKGKN